MRDRELDLADIQGNIIRPYGRIGFPVARHLFFNVGNAAAGRRFIECVRRAVTTAERWGAADDDRNAGAPRRPLVAVNVGISFLGLLALELPTRTLSQLPPEFIDGMAKRSSILGDVEQSSPAKWDPIWVAAREARSCEVHVCVSLSSQVNTDGAPVDALDERTEWLRTAAMESGGVTLLKGDRGTEAAYQKSAALMQQLAPGRMAPTAKEHFGFVNGIGDPVFVGQYKNSVEAAEATGNGKLLPDNKGWAPLAAGEFILGYPSEAQELPPTAMPMEFMRNGTFMVYRKLHQNIASFGGYVRQQATGFSQRGAAATQSDAEETIRAKMMGRWSNGIPLVVAPTFQESRNLEMKCADIAAIQLKGANRTASETARLAEYERFLIDFRYSEDIEGAKCPVSAHIRRSNPRDSLDPLLGSYPPGKSATSALSNRRRILRRGLPYGASGIVDDASEHGFIFMAICASLFNQFEFIQQQWIQYGDSFNVGNDTDPIVGMRRSGAKFVIPSDPAGTAPPFICANLPQFVEMRGGEYFFLPSLTALRQIAMGAVDPT
jgi:deferrochelatase/peroxidase EfeB